MVSIPAQAPRNPENQPRRDLVPVADASVEQYKRPQFLDNADRRAAAPNAPDRKSGNRLKWAALGAVGATAALVGLGVYATNEAPKRITGESDSAPSNSAEPFPTQTTETVTPILGDLNSDNILTQTEADLLSITDYASIDPQIRVEHKAESLNQYLYTAWDSIQPFLSEAERQVLYLPDLEKPRSEWSDQDYLNLHTLAVWLTSTQASDTQEGQQGYSAIANPNKNTFDDIVEHIEEKPGIGIKNVYQAVPTPLSGVELVNTTVGSIEMGPEGGRLIGVKKVGGTDIGYTLYSNRIDSKGNIMTVNEFTYESLDDRDLRELIQAQGNK
jgi:hypothetical protein